MFSELMSVYYKEQPEYLRAALVSLAPQVSFLKEIALVQDGPIGFELHRVISEFGSILPLNSLCLQKAGLAEALNIGLKECLQNEFSDLIRMMSVSRTGLLYSGKKSSDHR